MAVSIPDFQISDVVVHDVPKKSALDAEIAITFSEAPLADLDDERRNYFTERIKDTLVNRGFAVVHDSATKSSVPGEVLALLSSPAAVVDRSAQLARALYNTQTRVNTAGLLVVMTGNIKKRAAIAILKLQRQEGMRMEQKKVGGKRTYSARVFRDLMLTEGTRVFKASLFQATGKSVATLRGVVSDDQRGNDPDVEVANFFLSTYLGCKLEEEARVMTKRFYEGSRAYFETIADPERRLDYIAAVAARLKSTATTVMPSEFANEFLKTEDRQPFVEELAGRGVPDAPFDKDNSLVERRLARTTITTTRKVRISGAVDVLNEIVKYEAPSGTKSGRIIIEDTLLTTDAE